MADYSLKELEQWNERVEEIAFNEGLDCYPQEFEVCDYEDMIGYMSYSGMPSHYPHWSYGKAYEKIRTMHKYNLYGLPYEMVINSNPCLAYLMKDNTLLLQILTIAHVYGHNDFFKCNRLFREGTRAEYTVEMFKNHSRRIREYVQDPGIGYEKVEKILNAAHSVCMQTYRIPGEKPRPDNDPEKAEFAHRSRYPLLESGRTHIDNKSEETAKIPAKPEEDLLRFISEYGSLKEWEKDVLDIVRSETRYFVPQIETKIMNEGWASFWHYRILNKLDLPQKQHVEFLKRHNQVICPHKGSINPYYVGFKIFENLVKKNGISSIFEVRQLERDASFIRRYLSYELCNDMNLFEYEKKGKDYIISEVSDEEGWKKVRDTLSASSGMGMIPVIRVKEFEPKKHNLILEHIYDGRELELNYATESLKHIVDLWDGKVILNTNLENVYKSVICDENKRISIDKS